MGGRHYLELYPMRRILLLIAVPLLLTACLKDDLDPATLTTNPLDPDYNGTPLVVLVHDTVRVLNDFNGLPVDTVFEQKVRVRTELLSPLASWTWSVKNLNTGVTTPDPSHLPEYTSTVHHVINGSTHCFEYTLIAQFSPTKPYTYCGLAAW